MTISIADGETRGDHQESTREPLAAGTAHRIDRLPRNEHGHDRGLAGADRELERRRDLGQPDRGLRRFDLAEEGPDVAEAVPLASRARSVAAPVPEEPGRLRSHAPPARVRNRPPRIDPAAQLVDDLHQLVLLTLRLKCLRRLVEDQRTLAPLLRLRDWRDERDAPATVEDAARGLAGLVEFPVPRRVLVGGVEDRVVEEAVAHGRVSLSHGSA